MNSHRSTATNRWSQVSFGVGAAVTFLLLAAVTLAWLFAAAFTGLGLLPLALAPLGLSVWLAYSVAGYGSSRRLSVLATSFVGALAMLGLFARIF